MWMVELKSAYKNRVYFNWKYELINAKKQIYNFLKIVNAFYFFLS